jgi:alkyl hydroperoxide reductase subunit AhpC
VRQPLPSWKADALLPDGSFANLSNAWHAGKWAVLLFYPLDWTFVCPTEIIAFSDRAAEFAKLNCAVVGLSIDRCVAARHCAGAARAQPADAKT